MRKVNAFSPVIVETQGGKCILPAICAKYLMDQAHKQSIKDFINLHLMVGFMIPAPTSVMQRASIARLSRVEGGVIEGGQSAKIGLAQIENTITRLSRGAKYELSGTGEYAVVKWHHPLAKSAFEGTVYNAEKAFSVKVSTLEDAWKTVNSGVPQNIHSKITGQQNSLYTAWKKANPNSTLTIDIMADIEIQAMKNVGIPKDIATGWVVKALEDIKAKGVTEITHVPWNGLNQK